MASEFSDRRNITFPTCKLEIHLGAIGQGKLINNPLCLCFNDNEVGSKFIVYIGGHAGEKLNKSARGFVNKKIALYFIM